MDLAVFLRHRARVLGLMVALSAGVRCGTAPPEERSIAGLTAMLGEAVGGVVEPDSIVWEPSPGFLAETFFGRRVLFLSARTSGAPRDVYRARVRLAYDGTPIAVAAARNLTATPHGDDLGLEGGGERAAFATLAYGRVQAISVLETQGIREKDRPSGILDRVLFALSSLQETGSLDGVGRTDIVLDTPVRSAEFQLGAKELWVHLAAHERLVFDLEQRTLAGAPPGILARAIPEARGNKPFLLWAVDTLRAEVGPEPIALLERLAFGVRDGLHRAVYSALTSGSDQLRDRADMARARVHAKKEQPSAADTWPPPPIPSLWKDAPPSEGTWEPVTYSFLKPMRGLALHAGQPPPYFYRTVIRPDPERPYSRVTLIAFDMRQLELGMQAGYEDPKPTAGPPGEGRLPRDPAIYERVVATFNGAFKSTHGEYGMMVDRRVLLPPVPGAATVVLNDRHEVGLGTWPNSSRIPPELVAFRQNLEPLVDDGVVNPSGRNVWGWQLIGTSVLTQRTALCLTPAGHLYYAFAPEIDGKTLGRAMTQAGCSYAIHLDMNPNHCGFVFTDVRNPRTSEMTLKLAEEEMRIHPDKYARWSAKDFFYVMVRDATPRDGTRAAYEPDDGAQPPPEWLPGIWRGKTNTAGVDVSLVSIEPGRVDFRIRAGSEELGEEGCQRGVGRGFVEADVSRVLGAIGLGHTTAVSRYGLAYGSEALSPIARGYATLLFEDGNPPRVFPAGGALPPLAAGQQAVQLPILAEEGRVLESARETGELRVRSALCVTPHGRVLFAEAKAANGAALTETLVATGCDTVFELDRGSHHASFFHRAGTGTPPLDSYRGSALYLLARPMTPHAFRWQPSETARARETSSSKLQGE